MKLVGEYLASLHEWRLPKTGASAAFSFSDLSVVIVVLSPALLLWLWRFQENDGQGLIIACLIDTVSTFLSCGFRWKLVRIFLLGMNPKDEVTRPQLRINMNNLQVRRVCLVIMVEATF